MDFLYNIFKQARYILALLFMILIVLFALGIMAIFYIYKPNVKISKDYTYIYIPSGSNYNNLKSILYSKEIIDNKNSFEWTANKKNLQNHINPGRYRIQNKMTNNELINLLRSGKQEEVEVVINGVRTKEQLAGKASKFIEADSIDILNLLNDEEFIQKYGYQKNTVISLFIPNTYRFFWNTSAERFFSRMVIENRKFWTENRTSKAKEIGLSKIQVITLASIVEEETNKDSEKARLAGVYMNRLKKDMRLQADPTIIFALGDFTISRVLTKHLDIKSPYNTYRNKGLPPGPICIPSITSIDAVLNYEKHDYLYFCAKEDLSGFHYFAKTLKQHNVYAERYKKVLNKMRIYK